MFQVIPEQVLRAGVFEVLNLSYLISFIRTSLVRVNTSVDFPMTASPCMTRTISGTNLAESDPEWI